MVGAWQAVLCKDDYLTQSSVELAGYSAFKAILGLGQ